MTGQAPSAAACPPSDSPTEEVASVTSNPNIPTARLQALIAEVRQEIHPRRADLTEAQRADRAARLSILGRLRELAEGQPTTPAQPEHVVAEIVVCHACRTSHDGETP